MISALLFGVPVAAEEPVSDDLIVFWAHNAIPLAEYVEKGFGLSGPDDATSNENCIWQWNTISLAVAGSEVCDRVTAVRDAMSAASGN